MFGSDNSEDERDDFNNEYTFDDSLDNAGRFERYSASPFPLQRLVLMRDLYDTITELGYEQTIHRIQPLLMHFVNDQEAPVRQLFAEQLHRVCEFYVQQGGEAGYNEMVNVLLPFAFELIIDRNSDVSVAATASLTQIAQLLQPTTAEDTLLTVVVNLAHDERTEDYRIVAAQLFNEIAEVLGERVVRESLIPEVITLSQDTSFAVRKMLAANFGKICQVAGESTTVTRVLPIFLTLSKDEIWGVRKSCAESLVDISKNVSPDIRKTQLMDVFERLVEDVSRWVRNTALQQIGPFIATFLGSEVPDTLIHYYTQIAMQHNTGSIESDLIENCAFNFPAVTLALGAHRWKEIEAAYLGLIKDTQWKVRRTLACSIHEMAKILGPTISETILIQAFELFLLDLDEIKLGVVENLSSFLTNLGTHIRSKYIPMICNLPSDTDNWRIRSELAKQVSQLAELTTNAEELSEVVKLCIMLLEDRVHEVRMVALHNIGPILKILCREAEKSEGQEGDITEYAQVLDDLLKYVQHLAGENVTDNNSDGEENVNSFIHRQIFVYACGEICHQVPTDLFQSTFLPALLRLANDPVVNVRIAVAKVYSGYLQQNEKLRENSEVLKLNQILLADAAKDVTYFTCCNSTNDSLTSQSTTTDDNDSNNATQTDGCNNGDDTTKDTSATTATTDI